jgi:hypothetical protein
MSRCSIFTQKRSPQYVPVSLALNIMDSEILTRLEEIELLLIATLTVCSTLLVAQLAKGLIRLVNGWTVGKETAFIATASEYYDEGRYEELSLYCDNKMKKWQSNPYPIYWQARSKYKQGELDTSVQLFEKLLVMEPGWHGTVSPHIVQINRDIEGVNNA